MSSSRAPFHRLWITSAALAAAMVACFIPAHALTTEEILSYKGSDRQKVLEDGARKEGTVVLYSGMIVNQLGDKK